MGLHVRYHRPSSKCIIVFIVMGVVFFIADPMAAGIRERARSVPLKEGVFLVAVPRLMDPNFIHTVVLLISYGEGGASGLIINRPLSIHLGQVFPDIEWIKKTELPLYSGGPVNRDNLFILFASPDPPPGARRISGDLYFSERKDVILPVLEKGDPAQRIRVYSGYAGWAPGQLDREMTRGTWITVEADPEMIFTDNPYRVWPEIFSLPEELLVRI